MRMNTEWLKKEGVALLSALTAAMVGWMTFYGNNADRALKTQVEKSDLELKAQVQDLERKVSESAEARAERESLQRFQMDIYKLVLDSLKSRDAREQEAAQAFIVVMVDEPLRTNFMRVLSEGAQPAVREKVQQVIAQEETFKRVAVEPPVDRPSRFEDWDFDLFWCEASARSGEEQASSVKAALEAKGAKGRIRVRMLPTSLNLKAGYRVSGYQVRRNDGEEPVARDLAKLAEQTLPGTTFEERRSGQATAWYLSAFFCP
jgi:hypothetical protein